MSEGTRAEGTRQLGRGVLWVTIAQAQLIVGQFVSGGVTARIFAPEVFGGFAAALSLQAIFVMATTTGVPSYVLMRPNLSHGDIRRMRVWTAFAAVTTAALFAVVLPWWLILLQAPSGLAFVTLLSLSQCVTPSAALELALLRRRRKAGADAAIFGSAGLVGLIVATTVAVLTRAPSSLAVAPLVTSGLTLPLALIFQGASRRGDVGGPPLERSRHALRYLMSVSGVNAMHFTITQIPTWVISISFGSRTLGFYSRATSLTSTAATGLFTSLGRVIQPYWRDRAPGAALERALSDALRVTSGISFPLFSVIAVLAPSFVAVGLGEGWQTAGELAVPLALGAAFQVPFAIITAAYEMKARLGPVRNAQFAMLLMGAAAAAAAASGSSPIVVVALFSAMPLSGLVWLIGQSQWRPRGARLRFADLVRSAWWGVATAAAALAGTCVAYITGLTIWGSPALATLLLGGLFACATAGALARTHPLARVLRERRQPSSASSS